MEPTTNVSMESPASGKSIVWAIVKSMRPHQWVKNVFVLAPVFFSKAFLVAETFAIALFAALLFSLTSSAVYLLNDVFDVEKDRQHPVKCKRPIASGLLPIPLARIAAVVMGLGSVACAFAIDVRFGAVLATYLVMNFAYSASLKHVAFVDVSIIAIGFVFRVVSGALAIDVYMSEWLFGCTFLLALFLALGKRQHELRMYSEGRTESVRKVLERYRPHHLDFAVLFVAGNTIACYSVYTLKAFLPGQPIASPYMPATIPFVVFGITRFYQLINTDSPHSPTDLLLRDIPFIINGFLWVAVLGAVFFL